MDNIEEYIQKNKIKANALIFRDWEEFLRILYESDRRVEMIVWYEYCRINEQLIGMGGYIDIDNKGFMWAETQFFETDLQDRSCDEILDYISKMREKYSEYDYTLNFICAEFFVSLLTYDEKFDILYTSKGTAISGFPFGMG